MTQYALLAAVIAGITELISRLRAADYWTAATIVSAAITGAIFGMAHVEGLTVVSGLAAGFGTSGALTGLGMLGNRSSANPSSVLRAKNRTEG